jgi:hypothetical protein
VIGAAVLGQDRQDVTYESGKVVQTNGATSIFDGIIEMLAEEPHGI